MSIVLILLFFQYNHILILGVFLDYQKYLILICYYYQYHLLQQDPLIIMQLLIKAIYL